MGIFKNWFKLGSKDSDQSDNRTSQGTVPMPSASPVTKTIMPRSLRPVSLAAEGEKSVPPQAVPGPAIPLPDKEIVFQLGDFADRIPPGVLKTGRLDLQRQVTFHSRDLYSDLSRGKASVTLSKLAQVCPEIFSNPESLSSEETSINLPLQKLVEQIGEFHFRSDQQLEEQPSQVFETPFSRGAMQDGGQMIPVPASISTAVPHSSPSHGMLPKSTPTVRTSGGTNAVPRSPAPIIPPGMRPPPATVRASVSGGKIKIGAPSNYAHDSGGNEEQPVQKSIPFPQSPVQAPAQGNIPLPTKNSATLGVKLPSSLPPVEGGTPNLPPKTSEGFGTSVLSGNVKLNLASVFRALPAYLLNGDAGEIDNSVNVEFPIALVQPQIRTGKVLIPAATFQNALPESYRPLINTQEADSGIPLPLRDIVSALPQSVLQHRGDQIRQEIGEEIPTPFSDKAKEDAARLKAASAPPPSDQVAEPEPVEQPEIEAEEPVLESAETGEVSAATDSTPVAEAVEQPPVIDDQKPKEPEPPEEQIAQPPPASRGREIKLTEAEAAALKIPTLPHHPAEPKPAAEPRSPQPVTMPVSPVTTGDRGPKPFIKSEIVGPDDVVDEAEDHSVPTKPEPLTPLIPTIPLTPSPEAPREAAQAPEVASVQAPEAPEAEEPPEAPVVPVKTSQAAEAAAALQQMFMTDDTLDARKIAALACGLPGLTSTVICTADGLRLASSGSDESLDSISAIAPHFFQRTGTFVTELKLGTLRSFTVETEKGFVTFFRSGTISLVAKHGTRELMPGVRGRLRSITTELNRMYGDCQNA